MHGLILRDYQEAAVGSIYDYFAQKKGEAPLVCAPTGCHARGTCILMFDGSTKAVEDVSVGDILMGPDSRPRRVLRLASGHEPLYRITPKKGEPFVVNHGHVLSLQTTNEGKAYACTTTGKEIENITVGDWLNRSKSWKHLRKLRRSPVEFPVIEEPPLDPWALGVLLGDGCVTSGISICNPDFEVLLEFDDKMTAYGLTLRWRQKPGNKAYDAFFADPNATRCTPNRIMAILRALGVAGCTAGEKFVPDIYKLGSRQVRIEVLAGLIDTDGHYGGGVFDFISKSRQLADDVVFISRSLGLWANVSECEKYCQTGAGGTYWRVTISGDIDMVTTRVPRKQAAPRKQRKNPLVTGFDVEPIGNGEFFGFTLDGDHLYLTADFVVHHNSGKSLIAAAFMQRAVADFPGTRVLCVTHVRELIAQNYKTLIRIWPEAPAGIYSAGLGRRQARAQLLFAGVQSIHKRASEIGHVDLVVVDECFVAGTLVQTADGKVPIEAIRPGDIVRNATGYGLVQATSQTLSSEIWVVETSDGRTIECTGNHLFFTGEGWVEAKKMERGSRLFSSEDVRALRRGVSSIHHIEREADGRASMGKAEVLLNILLEEGRKRHVGSGLPREDAIHPPQDWAPAKAAIWEWIRPDEAAERSVGMARGGMESGTRRSDENSSRRRIPHGVQDRRSECGSNDRNRGGREYALREEIGRGSSEGCAFGGARVVRVSHSEQRCTTPVYNLQVSGHHSYFAGGVLVHNCHLMPRSMDTRYGRLVESLRDINPRMKIVGLTATPYRLDSGNLHTGDGAIFDGIACDIPVAMLVERKYLAPLISKRPGAVFDTRGLHVARGDFIEREMVQRFGTEEATRAAVAEIVAMGEDRRSWIAFCISVDHAMQVRDELRRHEITAETITGDTANHDRDRLIRAFKDGRIRCLTSVGVLTTGFDAPRTDLLAMLRPTQSTGLYVQMAGRGMRIAEGKSDCKVLDFAGNVFRHGPIDAICVPEKKGGGTGEGEAPAKECPNCHEIVRIAARECFACGFEFQPPEPKIDRTASTEAIMNLTSDDNWEPVVAVDYRRHEKHGAPDSLRVEYLIGFAGKTPKAVSEWVCFEHGGFPRQKAVAWWQRWAGTRPPDSVGEALARLGEVQQPGEAVLHREGKYYRIKSLRAIPARATA